jgi:predicted ATPase
MKLKSFVARGVYGYLNFKFELFDSITFLSGPNGSGKSTALQLMEALLTPSIKELALTDFRSAELQIEDAGIDKTISATKDGHQLRIGVTGVSNSLVLPELSAEQANLLADDSKSSEEYFRSLSINLAANEVFKTIRGITAPVFLGVERRHKSARFEEGFPHHEFDVGARRGLHARRILRGNLAAGLSDTQLLVQEAYRTARRQLDSAQESLRSDVLLSAFHYSKPSRDADGNLSYDNFMSMPQLDARATRISIETALIDVGLPVAQVQKVVRPFFEKLANLIARKESPDDNDDFLEFLMNRGQLDRLNDLISLVQEHKKKTDGIFRKINQFVETVNWFYVDGSKKVSIDPVGRLEVARSDGFKMPLDALSSGERQLVIIFAHIYFNAFGSRSRVFVIDEPELSLHLRWQENLVAKAQESAPGMQLILATHSPDIVGEYRDHCVDVT